MSTRRLRTKRIKTKLGDIIAIPYEKEKRVYSTEFDWLWEPKPEDKVAIAQVTALSATSNGVLLLLLFEGFYTYEEALKIEDITNLTPTHHIHMIGEEIRIGIFKIINNLPLREDTPYFLYQDIHTGWVSLAPFWSIKSIPYPNQPANLPETNMITGGVITKGLSEIAVGKKSKSLENFEVKKDRLLSKYYPISKNNPMWVLDNYKNNLRG